MLVVNNASGWMKKQIAALSILFVLCLSLAPSASAQEMPSAEEAMKTIFVIIFGEGFPDAWLTYQGFLQFVVFPFVALFAVFYGIMSEIRIFRTHGGRNAQTVIAVVMALVSGSVALNWMRAILIGNAWLGTIGFGAILVIGIIFWILGGAIGGIRRGIWEVSGRDIRRTQSLDNRIRETEYALENVRRQLHFGNLTDDERRELQRTEMNLGTQLTELTRERRGVQH